MLAIHRDRGWRSGGRDGPTRFHSQGQRVNRQYFALVLQVVIDRPVPVGDREFWATTKVNNTHLLPGCRINRGRIMTVPIKGEDVLRGGIVNDAIGIRRGN